jgi:two-component system response regulator ResD
VLVIDDEEPIRELLAAVLTDEGYIVITAADGATARQMIRESAEGPPDLIILDLLLPDTDGLLLCADLKAQMDVAIIICSATHRQRDLILGLKLGADDFIAKPLQIEELLARVDTVLRRTAVRGGAQQLEPEASVPATGATATAAEPVSPVAARDRKSVGALTIDHARRRVTVGDEVVQLTPTEYRLLYALASRPDEVLTWEELAEAVWGYRDAKIGRAAAGQLRRLRTKLNASAAPAPQIVAVRGFGYKLAVE